MVVTVLGIGGFKNEGLPFNSYCIDKAVLVDTPPDILQSLAKSCISLTDLKAIVLTHFHGDHYFGLPFLLFNLYMNAQDPTKDAAYEPQRITIFGPPGMENKIRQLLSLAIHPDHAYITWFFEHCELVEISEGSRYSLNFGTWLEFRHSVHSPETFSVMAGPEDCEKPLFAATSDTKWDNSLLPLFESGATLFLCDSNGCGFGDVHMSPEEIVKFVLPRLPVNARLLATHVSCIPTLQNGGLEFASPFTDYLVY